jgi:cysteinyl-tRNA synthetase
MPDYGKLSNRSLDEMEAGARVEVAPYKKGSMDFVLWKPSKPGEPAWPSPCGITAPGRPGWHIECSAMSGALLGPEFDIHGGGIDLAFPHHENEIAQSRCAHGTPVMAKVWMHNGFLQVEGEKMSKSLGNFITIHELLQDWPGEVLRLNMLRTHYRQPIDWTKKSLEESAKTLDGWFRSSAEAGDAKVAQGIVEALCDDLNTPKAIAELHRLESEGAHKALASSLAFLGFSGATLKQRADAKAEVAEGMAATVQPLIAARLNARKRKDFAESDRIRDELAKMGIALKDTKNKETGEIETTWEVMH